MKSKEIKAFEKNNNISLPKDTISETGLIGTLLEKPEFILKSDYIKPSMFYNRELGCVYHIISEFYSKGITEIDTFMLLSEIENNNNYKKAFEENDNIKNIDDYLEDLRFVARSSQEEYDILAKNVISASFKRDSYIKLNMLSKDILESKEDINKVNYDLQQQIADFSKVYICNEEVLTLGEQVDKIWDNIVGKRNNGFFGFPSKFSELNRYMTYEKTELSMIASPGKTGKSQFLANETWNMVLNGVPSLYIDRELSTENHMIRL